MLTRWKSTLVYVLAVLLLGTGVVMLGMTLASFWDAPPRAAMNSYLHKMMGGS